MTDIDAMAASSALDRLVAEKVMGWTLYHYTKSHTGHWEWLGDDRPIRIACGSVRGYFTERAALDDWQPSTDIGHAWEVVERFQSRGWGFAMTGYPTGGGVEPGEPFAAAFFCKERPELTGFGSAPIAICLAALRAMR